MAGQLETEAIMRAKKQNPRRTPWKFAKGSWKNKDWSFLPPT
jgi:hypothetical protein